MKNLTQTQREFLVKKLNEIIENENINNQTKMRNKNFEELCNIDTHLNEVLIEVINKTLIQNSLSININIENI